MLSLLYKDFKLQKIGIRGFIICFIIFFVAADQANIQNHIYRMLVPILVYSYVIIGISYDNYYRVEGVLLSLPVSKKDIVLSKYINILIAVVWCVIITIGIIFVASLRFNISFIDFLSLKRLFLSLCGASFIVVLLIPAYLKYGLIKGKVLTFVAMIIFVGINIIFGVFDEVKFNIFESNYSIIILIGLVIISLLVSYNISFKLYERREF